MRRFLSTLLIVCSVSAIIVAALAYSWYDIGIRISKDLRALECSRVNRSFFAVQLDRCEISDDAAAGITAEQMRLKLSLAKLRPAIRYQIRAVEISVNKLKTPLAIESLQGRIFLSGENYRIEIDDLVGRGYELRGYVEMAGRYPNSFEIRGQGSAGEALNPWLKSFKELPHDVKSFALKYQDESFLIKVDEKPFFRARWRI